MSPRALLAVDVGLKAVTIGLTALGAFGGLERFEEKGFGWRLLEYPIAILALPAVWGLCFRGRRYPYAADILLTLPFFIDVLGNVLDLYDTIGWWDDVNHFANWLFLSLGAGALLLRTSLRPVVIAGLVVGFGATLSILWEIGEYLTFVQENEEELATAYEDTILDLVFDMAGAFLAAAITGLAARRARASPRAPNEARRPRP
jgi:hypothetical protein